MKTAATFALFALAVCVASAADVMVKGAQRKQMTSDAAAKDVRVATSSILNHPTALLNKNNVATDNNVMIARSNIIMTQNDRLTLADKVREALTLTTPEDSTEPMATAVLTKNVLRAVSGPTDGSDSALMTKASAVVAAKNDPDTLTKTIARFVDAAMTKKDKETEQSTQSTSPRSVIMRIGTTDVLRQPTAVINKNAAKTDNQLTVSRSAITPTQNDQVVLRGNAKVADVVAPASAIKVGKIQMDKTEHHHTEEMERKKKKKMMKPGKKEADEKDDDRENDDSATVAV